MTRPVKGTPEWQVMVEAINVATAPPLKQGTAFAAQVPWTRIQRLRDALDAADIDWRKVKENS